MCDSNYFSVKLSSQCSCIICPQATRIYFPRFILLTFFSFVLIYGWLGGYIMLPGLGVGVLDWVFRVLISVDRVLGLVCLAIWVCLGWGSL